MRLEELVESPSLLDAIVEFVFSDEIVEENLAKYFNTIHQLVMNDDKVREAARKPELIQKLVTVLAILWFGHSVQSEDLKNLFYENAEDLFTADTNRTLKTLMMIKQEMDKDSGAQTKIASAAKRFQELLKDWLIDGNMGAEGEVKKALERIRDFVGGIKANLNRRKTA